ncbi:MAG TPA: hypothetical protein VFM29_00060, partial [Vicinamibacteria bacterium]|nr:hypothetical protein [Vicinamibacteria bacterium]
VDVKRFVASPFYQRMKESDPKSGPGAAFKELEEKTGLNPERDLESVYVAGRHPGAAGTPGGVVVVTGTFDRYKLSRSIETSGRKVTTKSVQGVSVYLFDEAKGRGQTGAVGFLEENLLVMGSLDDVEKVIATRATGQGGIKSNPAMVALLENVRPGSTFWMVGDQSVLDRVRGNVPAPGGGPAMALPGLKSMIVTGDLDPELSLEITGEAQDEAAARQLADVVRGFVALAQLQSSQKPELKQLASAVSVTTEASRLRISARFPYELLDALKPKKPTDAASAGGRH